MLERQDFENKSDAPADTVAQDDIGETAPAADKAEAAAPKRSRRSMALMLIVPLLLVAGGLYVWLTGGDSVETDNAYVQQDRVAISSEIGGPIIEVAVKENETVEKGQLLFRIDPEPYRIAVRQADADIAAAQVSVQSLASDARATGVSIDEAREAIRFAQIDLERQQALMERGFTTRARLDEAEHKVEMAREQLRGAQASAEQARARLATGSAMPGVNPAIAQARLDREQAQLNLKRTEVRAPIAGRVALADRLQVGQMMVSGLPALTVVADNRSWVEANFKETDLTYMRVGQPAEVRLDAYPDVALKGVVESIGAGTGSEFSVLPAQNATGNWVKVTQRVPVRIRITGKPKDMLIAGLSATVKVDIRSGRDATGR